MIDRLPRLSLRNALLASLLVILVAEGVVFAMGHPLICKCGYVKLWHGGRGDSEMSQHIADWYTYSHVLHGVIFYWLISWIAAGRLSVAARLLIAVFIEAGWEVFENTPFIINRYRSVTISRNYFGDSVINSTFDIVAMMLGFLLASRLATWIMVALIIAVEVGLLFLIRDNLILNIIMLVHPIDAIRVWQAGG
ncbi:MAG: DUF2585 family protein [Hyphomicrobiales bacterium]|nr:MAG: DUF2585 family protein [Hyphomicrobiales bacterium]